MRDLMNNIYPKPVIAPAAAAQTDNTAIVGTAIDRAGFDSLTYVILTGTLADADATFTVLLEESDVSGSGYTAVDDKDLIGTEALAGFTFAADGACRKLGYKGGKRWTRLTVTPANNTGNVPIGAIAILGHPSSAPTADPPA